MILDLLQEEVCSQHQAVTEEAPLCPITHSLSISPGLSEHQSWALDQWRFVRVHGLPLRTMGHHLKLCCLVAGITAASFNIMANINVYVQITLKIMPLVVYWIWELFLYIKVSKRKLKVTLMYDFLVKYKRRNCGEYWCHYNKSDKSEFSFCFIHVIK